MFLIFSHFSIYQTLVQQNETNYLLLCKIFLGKHIFNTHTHTKYIQIMWIHICSVACYKAILLDTGCKLNVLRWSENMQQKYRRTPIPKSDFNKVAKQFYSNFTLAWMFSCKCAECFQNTFSFLRTPLDGCFWTHLGFNKREGQFFITI